MEEQTGSLIDLSNFCQPIKAAANTLLTNENARILKHTIYEPSLLIFHGKIDQNLQCDYQRKYINWRGLIPWKISKEVS